MDGAATTHGFRASFRSRCSDRAVDREVAERWLAHVVANKSEAAYDRSDMLERRRANHATPERFSRRQGRGNRRSVQAATLTVRIAMTLP